MLNKVLLTPVDHIVEHVKQNGECTLTSLKDKFNIQTDIIEKWLVILEENGVLKVKYKGFEGYISHIEVEKQEDKEVNIDELKNSFIQKSKLKKIPFEKMKLIWPVFVAEHENEIKDKFERRAKRLGYDATKVAKAWIKYREELEKL